MVSLLLLGLLAAVALWAAREPGRAEVNWWTGPWRWAAVLLAAGLAAVPAVAAVFKRTGERVRSPSPRGRAITSLLVGGLAFVFLLVTALGQSRELYPKTHDDLSYLLQMRMLAGGKLWLPSHPHADFFDTFYVLARPVYGSLYFPGAALLYLPTIWFDLPTWLLPLVVAAAIVGLTYRIVAELVDGSAGLLAALAVVSISYFRVYSVLLTSHEPMVLLGLLMVWAFLRWRAVAGADLCRSTGDAAQVSGVPATCGTRSRAAWTVLIGALAGWAAITRPADALCWALPVGVAMLLETVRRDTGFQPVLVASHVKATRKTQQNDLESAMQSARVENPCHDRAMGSAAHRDGFSGELLRTVLLLVVGALPFLALQAWFNHGVTGSVLQTPYGLYLRQDQPGSEFGFRVFDPTARPVSMVPQKQAHFDAFYAPYAKRHQPGEVAGAWGRLYAQLAADVVLPSRLWLVFLPAGLLLLRDRGRWIVVAALPLLLIVYVLNPFFLEHYALVALPGVALLAMLGLRATAGALPKAWQLRGRAAMTAAWIASCIVIWPQFNGVWAAMPTIAALQAEPLMVSDETFRSSTMAVRQAIPLSDEIAKPALVLVKWNPGDNLQAEPVYNTDTAWPDDAAVIFAHDLGPAKNAELIAYYRAKKPGLRVYLWNRKEGAEGVGVPVEMR